MVFHFSTGASYLQLLGQQHGAIESHPGHHLRIGELLRPAARLPYAFIGLLPDVLQMLEQQDQHAEVVFGVAAHAVLRMEKRVQHLAVDIELHLLWTRRCRRARARIFIAGEPVHFPFHQLLLAFDAVHDLHLVGASGERAQQPILPGFGLVESSRRWSAPAE